DDEDGRKDYDLTHRACLMIQSNLNRITTPRCPCEALLTEIPPTASSWLLCANASAGKFQFPSSSACTVALPGGISQTRMLLLSSIVATAANRFPSADIAIPPPRHVIDGLGPISFPA